MSARRRRVALLAALVIVVGAVLVWVLKPTGPRGRLLDEAAVISV